MARKNKIRRIQSLMKMPKRTKVIKLDDDYEGFECTILTSFPMAVFSYFKTGQWDLIQSALKMILVDWNFVDTEGKPLPQPGEMVAALDAQGEPYLMAKTDAQGEPVLNADGQEVNEPLMISAISLIPPDLGMLIVGKASEAVLETPTP
jgi:hypothetical protein